METIKVEFTPLEAQLIRSIFGHTASTPEIKGIFNKLEKYTKHVYYGDVFNFNKIIEAVNNSVLSPLEQLLIKNGFKKYDSEYYKISLGYNNLSVQTNNGVVFFAGNRLHPISSQSDIDKLLHVFGS